jgi:peptidoglycan/LPS O-acetylase OafA/YrhL
MFFMITGYLFWSRMIVERGRPDWIGLYISRIFRIGPLYLVAVGTMLAAVFVLTGFRLNEPAIRFGENLVRWGLLGFVRGSEFNGFASPGQLLADVTWTLRYEWWFYLSLVVTALATRNPRLHLAMVLAALVAALAYLIFKVDPEGSALTAVCVTLFLQGMLCASLRAKGLTLRMPEWASSVLVTALGIFVFSAFDTTYRAVPVLLLGIIFYLIICGSSVFGLLLTRPARRLGDISYGIYLLQGLVLYFIFSIGPVRAFALVSPARHWSVICVCALLLTACAALTHRWIELPGIRLGKRAAAVLSRQAVRKLEPTSASAIDHRGLDLLSQQSNPPEALQ